MKLEEYKKLENMDNEKYKLIEVEDLVNQNDRTLLYGYTLERKTFHVYLKNQNIYTVVYETDYSEYTPKPKNMRQIEIITNHDYVPSKRLYPERCDYEFCRLLKMKEICLPFTCWTDDIKKEIFYGFTLEELNS